MYPPHADNPPGAYPAALLNDPETVEEVYEALAIARASARALVDEIALLSVDRARLEADLDRLLEVLTYVAGTLNAILTDAALRAPHKGDYPTLTPLALERLHLVLASVYLALGGEAKEHAP